MPTNNKKISWTDANDRKFLLLLTSNIKINVSLSKVRKMWGPDPPSEAALRQRLQKLRKLANIFENSTPQETTAVSRHGGLVTPTGSPKTPTKRPLPIEETEFTPRRAAKRRASQNVKYCVSDSDDGDDGIDSVEVKWEDESEIEESEWETEMVTCDPAEDSAKALTILVSDIFGEEVKVEREDIKEEIRSVQENTLDDPNQES